MVIIVIVTVIAIIFQKRGLTEKGRARLLTVKRLVFYNPIIRYLTLNALKLNLVAISTFKKSASSVVQLTTSAIILALLNLAPIVFAIVLNSNRDRLLE